MKVASQITMLFFVVALAAGDDSACADDECDTKDTQVLLQSNVALGLIESEGRTIETDNDTEGHRHPEVYHMVKQDVECGSSDENMGRQATAQDCANAVSKSGGQFFVFGKADKAGNCWKENTMSAFCTSGIADMGGYPPKLGEVGLQGWQTDQYDFYSLGPSEYEKLKNDAECLSSDENMGSQATSQDCANAVNQAGGQFFIFGKGDKAGSCWKENTQWYPGVHKSRKYCKEGWETDQYNFYSVFPRRPSEYDIYSPLILNSHPKNVGGSWMVQCRLHGGQKCYIAFKLKLERAVFNLHHKVITGPPQWKYRLMSPISGLDWANEYNSFYSLAANAGMDVEGFQERKDKARHIAEFGDGFGFGSAGCEWGHHGCGGVCSVMAAHNAKLEKMMPQGWVDIRFIEEGQTPDRYKHGRCSLVGGDVTPR